jgi:hypothetical protein
LNLSRLNLQLGFFGPKLTLHFGFAIQSSFCALVFVTKAHFDPWLKNPKLILIFG